MSIIFVTYQKADGVSSTSVNYTRSDEKDRARQIFEQKTGKQYKLAHTKDLLIIHIPIQINSGCNPRDPDGCFQCGTNGTYTMLNKKGQKIIGYNVEHLT